MKQTKRMVCDKVFCIECDRWLPLSSIKGARHKFETIECGGAARARYEGIIVSFSCPKCSTKNKSRIVKR